LFKNGFKIKIADRYIRVFDCFIGELQYFHGVLSSPGTGFAGIIILQLAVHE